MKTWGPQMLGTDLLHRLGRGLFVVAVGALTLLPAPVEAADAPGRYDPVADPRAVVSTGHARFTILTPQLIRMEWDAGGKFEDRASLVFLNRRLPVPEFTHESAPGGGRTVIQTGVLKLVYAPGNSDGKFAPDNLSITFSLNGKKSYGSQEWRIPATCSVPRARSTGSRALRCSWNQGSSRAMAGASWTTARVSFLTPMIFPSRPVNDSPWPWVTARPTGERQDWYFFGYGHDYKRAALRFHARGRKDSAATAFCIRDLVVSILVVHRPATQAARSGLPSHETPLDVLVIDMDWHPTFGMHWWDKRVDQSGHTLGWTGYSWNKLLFPDPTQFLAHIHQEGLKATLNMHPGSGVQPWEDRYPEMARAMGIDPATKKYVPFDITDKKFATNYMNILHHPLEQEGIDFLWLDWQEESTTKLPHVDPIWWLNYVHFTDQEREGKRPLIFHRWGGLGNHRYQIGFSGDTVSVWDSLAFQPYFTATAANVGYAFWSHDIGGHMPGPIEPELYLRWIQFGTFSPILRTHTTKNPDSERRTWAYPEPYADLMRQSFVLRYALQPYIYTEARRTYDTGVAFLRPLYYDWPEASEAYEAKDEYMFGDEMLVAPVTQPVAKDSQLAQRSVWLPEGNWIEWQTGARLVGPKSFTRSFSIGQTPVYVKEGSIVPMQPPMRYTGEKPVDPLILNVFPLKEGQTSTYRLYEDAGLTGLPAGRICLDPDSGYLERRRRYTYGDRYAHRGALCGNAQGAGLRVSPPGKLAAIFGDR